MAELTAVDGVPLGPITIELTRHRDYRHRGDFVGIGVRFHAEVAGLRVDDVFPVSGAADAGVLVDDVITAIDGVASLSPDAAAAKITGPVGTTVTLTIRRGPHDLQLVVERRQLHS